MSEAQTISAASVGGSLPPGLASGAGAGIPQGGSDGAPAFLALLDQMFGTGRDPAGTAPPAPAWSAAAQGRLPTDDPKPEETASVAALMLLQPDAATGASPGAGTAGGPAGNGNGTAPADGASAASPPPWMAGRAAGDTPGSAGGAANIAPAARDGRATATASSPSATAGDAAPARAGVPGDMPQLPSGHALVADAGMADDGMIAATARAVPQTRPEPAPATAAEASGTLAELLARPARGPGADNRQASAEDPGPRLPARAAAGADGSDIPQDQPRQPAMPRPTMPALAQAEPAPAGAPQDGGSAPGLTVLNEIGDDASIPARSDAARLETAFRLATPATARPDVDTVALRIAHKAGEGSRRFEIELDPPELGRVEVRLEFGRDGRVTTHMLVDRADTLDALMRDARALERALQSGGLKLDGGVQYELRDQSSFAQSHGDRDASGRDTRGGRGADEDPAERPAPDAAAPYQRRATLSGIDVRI